MAFEIDLIPPPPTKNMIGGQVLGGWLSQIAENGKIHDPL
jgi:hypothetical protein